MTDLDHLLRRARDATEPTPEAVARVKARLAQAVEEAAEADVRDPSSAELLLRGVGAPTPASIGLVQGRLQRTLRRRAWLRRSGWAAITMAVAASALFVTWHQAPPPVAPEPDPPIAMTLGQPATGSAKPTKDVALSWSGGGDLTGTAHSPRIHWERGRLDVEVRPQAGVGLVVDTREARVSVIGTGFTVDRSPLGTDVVVSHGIVAVDCADGTSKRLTAGEQVLCLPNDLGGLLARARALHDSHAGPADELDAVDRALSLGGPTAIRGELLARRIRLLLDLGRAEDATATAHQYLDEGHLPRKAEILQATGLRGSSIHKRSAP